LYHSFSVIAEGCDWAGRHWGNRPLKRQRLFEPQRLYTIKGGKQAKKSVAKMMDRESFSRRQKAVHRLHGCQRSALLLFGIAQPPSHGGGEWHVFEQGAPTDRETWRGGKRKRSIEDSEPLALALAMGELRTSVGPDNLVAQGAIGGQP
jgi:hypothetical protein